MLERLLGARTSLMLYTTPLAGMAHPGGCAIFGAKVCESREGY